MRILITGAGRAIGRATADELVTRGHEVVATARDPGLLADLGGGRVLPLDVTDDDSVTACLSTAGELDAVVNNAALSASGPMESYPLDRLLAVLDTNTFGALRVLQPLLPAWRSRGSGVIVNVSSVEGRVATPLGGAYAASKYALEAISEALHYELGHFGIRVAIVEPGYIAPGMKEGVVVRGDDAYEPLWEEWTGADATLNPDGRTRPEIVARAIADAIEDPSTPLRVPVGKDAELVLGVRKAQSDADFEATMRATLDLGW